MLASSLRSLFFVCFFTRLDSNELLQLECAIQAKVV